MRYIGFKNIALFILVFCLGNVYANNKIYVKKGWNLKGTSYIIDDTKDFLDTDIVKSVQVYRNNKYITSLSSIGKIRAHEGFWLYAKKSGTLEFDNSLDDDAPSSSSIPSPLTTADSLRFINWNDDGNDCLNDWGHSWVDWWRDGGSSLKDQINYKCDDDSSSSTSDIKMELHKGWNLKGTSSRFQIKDIFNSSCVSSGKSITTYRNGSFHKYYKTSSSYISSDLGIYVKASSNCVLSDGNSDSSTIPISNSTVDTTPTRYVKQ